MNSAWVAFASIVFFVTLLRYQAVVGHDVAAIPMIAAAMLRTLVAMAIFLGLAHWLKWREIVLKRRTWFTAYAVCSLLAVSAPTIYRLPITQDSALKMILFAQAVLFALAGRAITRAMTEVGELRPLDLQAMFPIYPPQERLDLIRMDAAVLVILLVPFGSMFLFERHF